MEIVSAHMLVDRKIKRALKNASEETGKTRKVIIAEALEKWLIGHGFLDK